MGNTKSHRRHNGMQAKTQNNSPEATLTISNTHGENTIGEQQSRHARNLLQNAENFFQEAVSYIERGQERDWVFAVVDLAIALELTLKAVLQSEHWTLVFENIMMRPKNCSRLVFFAV